MPETEITFANSRQIHEIARLYELIRAAGCPYTLASLVEHPCNARTQEPSKLSPQEANSLIEAIKAIHRRTDEFEDMDYHWRQIQKNIEELARCIQKEQRRRALAIIGPPIT